VITDTQLQLIKEYAVGVGMSFSRINEDYVTKVREHGLLIHPYAVDSKGDMRKALEWGVTGLFTNFPDRFDEVITEFKRKNR
jgi:glycerophosphoryl diester phosphodiesterase